MHIHISGPGDLESRVAMIGGDVPCTASLTQAFAGSFRISVACCLCPSGVPWPYCLSFVVQLLVVAGLGVGNCN